MKYLSLLVAAAVRSYRHDAGTLAAAFSYYAPFALSPLMLLSLTIVGMLYGTAFVSDVFRLWGSVLGVELLDLIAESIDNLSLETASFTVPALGLLFFSTIVVLAFNALTTGFHQLWEVPSRGLRGFIEKSVRSAIFILVVQVYLVAMIGVDGFFTNSRFGYVPLLSTAIDIVCTSILFYLMYRLLPWWAPSMRACLIGALVASGLFSVSKELVVLYVTLTPVPSIFDSAGLIIAFLIWIYVVSFIVLYGAAVAHEYDKMRLRSSG